MGVFVAGIMIGGLLATFSIIVIKGGDIDDKK